MAIQDSSKCATLDMTPEFRELWEKVPRFRDYAAEVFAEFVGSFPDSLRTYSDVYITPWGRVRFDANRNTYGRRTYKARMFD